MIEYVCLVCQKRFLDQPSKHRLYCSRDCWAAAPSRSKRKKEHTCAECGRLFRDSPSRTRLFCSQACRLSSVGTSEDRFWSKVVMGESAASCWEWQGALVDGYGHFKPSGRSNAVRAHRFSYELAFGEIPPGEVVRHGCNNPACVNPGHLLTGSHQDNHDDMVAADRNVYGSRSPQAKLTEEVVAAIHWCLEVTSLSKSAVARQFGVHNSQVSRIAHGKAWRHCLPDANANANANANAPDCSHGQHHPRAKLANDDIPAIRWCHECTGLTKTAIARHFGVSQSVISRVLSGKAWAQSTEAPA